jgi:hypothetical protein
MGNLDVGPKETTGPVRNENGYTQTFDDPRRFITTYQTKYRKETFFNNSSILFFLLKSF